jgi:hypothetical protein
LSWDSTIYIAARPSFCIVLATQKIYIILDENTEKEGVGAVDKGIDGRTIWKLMSKKLYTEK